MFEGLVRQLILGYLGQYVKDISKEQLKITLWNEEVFLENVELILEAFEYLQLPFALKEGRVGRLSIKIPWKKLGWDPIIIILEDVFVCASQRDEREWSLEEVEKREFAGKKAKLAAAELAKLSRRVCDNQAGQSFISYITAKILDSIQVSIRNFHVSYKAIQNDVQSDYPMVELGLRFSSLTIMKQTSVGMRGQVNKTVEISGLEVYCSSCSGASSLVTIDSAGVSKSLIDSTYDVNQHQRVLVPLDVSVSLSVNRSGKLYDDAPQYSIGVEITCMVMRLDEFQLQQILILLDDLCICRLREKYGRYRPLCSLSLEKPNNWQRLWWQYAQQSVLSDVRKKLKRTSWRYFGLQLSYRRKYINLYKKKLSFLKQEQLVDEEVLEELEQMERESDIDDILSYRSTAERELQEQFSDPPTSASGLNSLERSRNDSSGKSRGWLNWLSRGMLGAGGTEDSSQFSGIVSDEVIKDIYEATEFDPRAVTNGDDITNDKMFKCSFNLFVQQFSATIGCTKTWENGAELLLDEISVECKLWEDSASMVSTVGNVRIICPHDQKVIVFGDMDYLQNAELPSCRISINVLPMQELGLSLKVMIQPVKITFDVDFLLNCMAFFGVFESFEFQHDRVLSSLNGVKDNRARILSKAEFALSSPTKVAWEVSVLGITLNVPGSNACSEHNQVVFQCGNLSLKSIYDLHEDGSHILKDFLASFPKSDFAGIQFLNLYDHFEITLIDAEVKLVKSSISESVPVLEKFSFSVILASSIIPDEELLKQLEVFMTVSMLQVHFSPTIHMAAMDLIMHGDSMFQRTEFSSAKSFTPCPSKSNYVDSTFNFAIAVNLGTMYLDVNLENEDERGYACLFCMKEMDMRCDISDQLECWIRTKALKVISYLLKDEKENHTLCSFGSSFEMKPGQPYIIPNESLGKNDEIGASLDPCFLLHYETCREDPALQRCTICLNDGDLHCYPHTISLLVEFFDRIAGYNPNVDGDSSDRVNDRQRLRMLGLGHQRFGFSNFVEVSYPENESIHFDQFPFVMIKNSGHFGNFNSTPFGTSDRRKSFSARTKRSRSSKSFIRKRPKMVLFSSSKSFSGFDTTHGRESGHSNELVIDISFFGVRVHFHDSSCIVGTITLPLCKAEVFVYGQSVDILCSTEGLTLTSSWTKRLHELLWGPATKDLHPILNVRVRIQNAETNPQTEISIGLQHVCCILPPEYLAILIGYFSLPDWISNSSKQSQAENDNNLHMQQSVMYKFEILDSILILPVENKSGDFLKLEIPQLCSSFAPEITLNGMLEGIPFDCLVPEKKVAEKNHALNVFGQQLSLSLLSVKDYGDGWLNIDQVAFKRNLVLISPLSADVWVRIPCEDGSLYESSCNPTCIMGKIEVCKVIVDDGYLLHGIEALVIVTDLFSSVVDESKAFTCDVLQFLQVKKCHMGRTIIETRVPAKVLTEVQLSVDLLTMKMHHSLNDLVTSEPVAETDMQFRCSVSLRNNTIESMAFSFSSLAVYSSLSSVVLARCTSTSLSSVLGIKFTKSEVFRDEISIFLPSLHIWLEPLEWTKVIDSLNLFAGQLTQLVITESSSKDPTSGSGVIDNRETALPECSCPVSDSNIPENMDPDRHTLLMRSENICITVHFPFLSNNGHGEYGKSEFQKTQHHRLPSIVSGGKQRKFIALTLLSKNTELYSDFKMYRLKSIIEKASASAGIYEEVDNNRTWPFLQIFKVRVEAEVYVRQMEIMHVATDIRCDHTDVGLSHKVFYFFQDVEVYFPEGGSPEISLNSIDCNVQIRKVSLLLTDGRWSCSGPLLEMLMRNLILHANATKTLVVGSVASDLELNYNNIHKVMWEPFMEPWKFQLNMTHRREVSILLNSSILTDIHFKSMAPLNLNCTESLLECFCRTAEMVQDAWDLNQSNDHSENHSFFESPVIDDISAGRYAPYILQNLTSLPLTYQILQGSFNPIEALVQDIEYWNSVLPDSFVPIYIKETPEEQLLRFRPAHSSDRLNEKQSIGVTHHFIRIQLDGTTPSVPISMDLVGVSYFEVDFSKEPNRLELDGVAEALKKPNDVNGDDKNDAGSGFILPVVFDVSISRFSKLIRIYSTVILMNETSLPLELRFDIPLGVSPKIMDPIYPGQKFPLPLHLAEAGRVRWRPLGGSYVWSEAHNLSNILSQESKIGLHRSFVCYPSHPSSDPFRCCLVIKKISLPSSKKAKQVSFLRSRGKQSMDESDLLYETDKSAKRFIYQLTLCTPLVVHNYLPEAISLTIDSGGVSHPVILSEVDSFLHHVDPSHDLGLVVCMQGFQPSILRFPHIESFSAQAKFDGRKFTQTETLIFYPVVCNCPIYVTMEKTMDAFSGARELFLFVPFLLYNCIGFPLSISVAANEVKETVCHIPSCYSFVERDLFEIRDDGLSLLSSDESLYASASQTNPSGHLSMRNPIFSNRRNSLRHGVKLPGKSSTFFSPTSIEKDKCAGKKETKSPSARGCLSNESALMNSSFVDNQGANVKPYAYSPTPSSSMDNIVRISKYLPEDVKGRQTSRVWSNPFPLFPPSGSNSVLIPLPDQNAAYILSVSSVTVPEQLTGRTRAITFQPRYVICNACSKDLCYRQKGTDSVFHLDMGQHSHLHWTDTTRDLLISICYNEPGWQWAGSFLPDILGDTQVKIWNYISGALKMIRVEVQNADMFIKDGKIATSLHRISGTNLILLSDDDTGYMPYRIENFSKERLRIYQQRCENFETIVHPYQSSPYAWDEPCYPHRLTVEVPGERVLGSYALDDVKDIMTVHLPSTSEKPDRTLLISVRAEGATKVLSVVDSTYHVNMFHDNKKYEEQASFSDYKESCSIYISHIGVSLISSLPQEMIFACAKGISLDLLQSVGRQKLCFQVTSLQIDNQLHATPYPVILSFDHEYRSISANHDGSSQSRFEDLQLHSNSPCEPSFHLSLSKWRKKDESLSSFESITLRVADFHLELEQEIVLHLYDFFKIVYSRFENRTLPSSDPRLLPYLSHGHLFNDAQLTHPDLSICKAKDGISASLPSIVPIGAPWQHMYHLARRQKKIYVELFDLAPINFSLSFSSAPWMHRIGISMPGDSLMHRGLIALADIEGAQICLKQLTISHHMASWESIQEILVRHYSRQVLHEMYKVFGSAGVIGNPMGFARSLGLGIKDFLSVPLRNVLQSPTGLVQGMAQGTTSLFSRTVYALSDAATQFSKAAQKGIVALTFDEQAVAKMEMQQRGATSQSQGVINEVLEGLTGLLQSPIRGAEKHGLPGVLSGTALGLTGLVARPAASILEVTGKTAQSIRNRSKHYQLGAQRRRVRLPRPLNKDLPLRPYSWEEAIGTSVLVEADDSLKLKNEMLVICKALKQAGKFVILTETLVLIISCPSLVDFNKPEFHGIAANPEWVIESEIALQSVIHADSNDQVVHVVGSSSCASRQNQLPYRGPGTRGREWNNPPSLPLFQTDLELASKEEADNFLEILLSTIELGKGRGMGGGYVLHQCDVK